jgi:hypothetical protein
MNKIVSNSNKKGSTLEAKFSRLWTFCYPTTILEREYYFALPRKFRADFAHAESKVLIEIQGGVFTKSASHSSISGIKRDCEKQFLAASNGYLVFTLHCDMIVSNYLKVIAHTIDSRVANPKLIANKG